MSDPKSQKFYFPSVEISRPSPLYHETFSRPRRRLHLQLGQRAEDAIPGPLVLSSLLRSLDCCGAAFPRICGDFVSRAPRARHKI